MKVEELRIGNLTSAGVVNEILKDCFYVHDGESSLKSTWYDIKPIPLTEEILLKCGFEKLGETILFIDLECGSIYYNDELEKGISISIGEYCSRGICFENIKYLHQLQNLTYALTNQELNIEL